MKNVKINLTGNETEKIQNSEHYQNFLSLAKSIIEGGEGNEGIKYLVQYIEYCRLSKQSMNTQERIIIDEFHTGPIVWGSGSSLSSERMEGEIYE